MGSDSDLPVVQKAMDQLSALEIPYEVHIYSAHRTPVEARDFALAARENGFGALIAAVPLWALGTALGISMGNILPARIVSALSVALFGMFIAVIIPPSRKDRAVLGAVAVSFALSYAAVRLQLLSGLSQGNRTILLTVIISAVFAVLFPRKAEAEPEGGAADAD